MPCPRCSRRALIQTVGFATAGLVLEGCTRRLATLTPTAVVAPTANTRPRVAVVQAKDYDLAALRRQLRDLLDGLGGLGDVVHTGDHVVIKTNLTGGLGMSKNVGGYTPIESYVTHPLVVQALGELLRDAGARTLSIVEAVYDAESFPLWGYTEIAKPLGAALIDLNRPDPYKEFVRRPVGDKWFIYQDFPFHPVLTEADVFISAAKMKCHWACGVTHTLKNLIGLAPVQNYRLTPQDVSRSAFHGQGNEFSTRLPKIILDLNRARPIHFSLIDGIKTAESGEGPWIGGFRPVQPGLLVAGKNPVATDATATALMGFDPTAAAGQAPFLRSDNHLALADALGLGPHRLDQIEVVGPHIKDVRYTFRPCRE